MREAPCLKASPSAHSAPGVGSDMDLGMRRLAADDVQVPRLSAILSEVMKVIQQVNGSKRNTARLQYFARFAVERLIRIAEHMRGSWDRTPVKVIQKLDELEKVLREVSNALVKDNSSKWFGRSSLSSSSILYDAALTGFERRLDAIVESIFVSLEAEDLLSHETKAPTDSLDEVRNRTGIRILSLCGDGVRVLSQLCILRELMEQVSRLEQISGSPTRTPPRPCEYFDLIVGTGTGALSAIFLGRLEMTAQEAIIEYSNMTRGLSSAVSHPFTIDAAKFARHLETIVHARLGDPLSLMSNPAGCRTLVFAARVAHVDAPPEPFRSYVTDGASASQLTIVDVASAACASPKSPVSLGFPSVLYTNAAPLNYNNPTQLALDEAEVLWGLRRLELVLCVGTGARMVVDAAGGKRKLAEAHKHIASGSGDPVHDWVYGRARSARFLYHRLQVDRGLEHISADGWGMSSKVAETLVGVTEGYLRFKETQTMLWSCARVVFGRPLPVAVTRTTLHVDRGVRSWEIDDIDDIDEAAVQEVRIKAEETGIVTYSRGDVVLGEKMYLTGFYRKKETTFYKAVRLKDKQNVLVKKYHGISPASNKFLEDLKLNKLWDPVVPQFIGASKSTENPPFQVYQAPTGHFYTFSDWLWHTWHTNPGDVFRGLYDMRVSLKALDEFKRDESLHSYFLENHSLFFDSIVDVRSEGTGTRWKLIYTGDLFFSKGPEDRTSFEAYMGLVPWALPAWKNVPAPVAAFCDSYEKWCHDLRPLEGSPQSIAGLSELLIDHGWLSDCSGMVSSAHIGLGDVVYMRGSENNTHVVGSLHQDIVQDNDAQITFRLTRNAATGQQCEVVGPSGKPYQRTEWRPFFHNSDSNRRVADIAPIAITLEYCDKLLQEDSTLLQGYKHLWRVLRQNASRLSSQCGVPPHELMLVTSVQKIWSFSIEKNTEGLEPSDTEPSVAYIFESGNLIEGLTSSAPPKTPKLAASFLEEPPWLDDEHPWSESRQAEDVDDFTLMSNIPHTQILYLQLPVGAAMPHV